jgi:hypothetical protein
MSRVDTTSFAEILTRSLGQGANMAQNAASLQQRQKEAEAQQAFQQEQFSANEAQRAFGNDMATQRLGLDQLQFQTMTDRIAREQAAEQEDRMMGGVLGASSGVFDGYLKLSAQQNGGTPAPDDVMRVRKWTENGMGTRALTTLRDAVQKGADLSDMKAKAKRLGGLVDNMMADPKNEPALPALLLIKEMTLDPKTHDDAIREALGVIQQQQAAQQAAAEQSQLTGLMGQIEQPAQMLRQANNPELGPPISLAQPGARAQYVANAVPQLTPEQRLQVGSNPGLRSMFNQEADRVAGMGRQIMQPTMGERVNDAKRVAQLAAIANDQRRPFEERFAAAAQLKDAGYETASGMPTTGTVDQLPFLRKRVDDRKQEFDFAVSAAKAAGLTDKDGVIAEPKGTSDKPSTPNDPKRAAYATFVQAKRNYERSMADVRNAEQVASTRQTEPMLMSERDAQLGIGSAAASVGLAPEQDQQIDAAIDAWERANGRPPGSATPQEIDQIIASLGGGSATPR